MEIQGYKAGSLLSEATTTVTSNGLDNPLTITEYLGQQTYLCLSGWESSYQL